jgi:hypothetical protein
MVWMVDGQSHVNDCHYEAEDQDNLHSNESSITNGAPKDDCPQDNGGKETDGDAMVPMVDNGQSPSNDCNYEAVDHANFHPNESTRTNGAPQDNFLKMILAGRKPTVRPHFQRLVVNHRLPQ